MKAHEFPRHVGDVLRPPKDPLLTYRIVAIEFDIGRVTVKILTGPGAGQIQKWALAHILEDVRAGT